MGKREGGHRFIGKDLLGGADPSGMLARAQGVNDAQAGASRGHVNARSAVQFVGGAIGGATLIPAGSVGLVRGGSAFLGAKGRLGTRLSKAFSAGIEGAKEPFTGIYHAVKARNALRHVAKGRKNFRISADQRKSVESTIRGAQAGEFFDRAKSVMKGRGSAKALLRSPHFSRAAAKKALPIADEAVRLHSGFLGVGGGIGAASAVAQYRSGYSSELESMKREKLSMSESAMEWITTGFVKASSDDGDRSRARVGRAVAANAIGGAAAGLATGLIANIGERKGNLLKRLAAGTALGGVGGAAWGYGQQEYMEHDKVASRAHDKAVLLEHHKDDLREALKKRHMEAAAAARKDIEEIQADELPPKTAAGKGDWMHVPASFDRRSRLEKVLWAREWKATEAARLLTKKLDEIQDLGEFRRMQARIKSLRATAIRSRNKKWALTRRRVKGVKGSREKTAAHPVRSAGSEVRSAVTRFMRSKGNKSILLEEIRQTRSALGAKAWSRRPWKSAKRPKVESRYRGARERGGPYTGHRKALSGERT